MNQKQRREYLIQTLLAEQPEFQEINIPENEQQQKLLLRALFNVRMPKKVSQEFLEIQDTYLQQELAEKGIVDVQDLEPVEKGICLWQGDITCLKCDAIVNAANSGMLGCFHPNHGCIDNAIHTFAGIQLRQACAGIMNKQGHEEETGKAKITPAFNLPSRNVIHTVGPIVHGPLTEIHEEQLRSCYRSCLELAARQGLKSIAFCCISTGEFHFPNRKAAEIAVNTVREFQKENEVKVIFDVFKESDFNIYRELLG